MSTSILALESDAEHIKAFIQETIPAAATLSKYGGTLFTLTPEINESQFCGVFIYKEHVQIVFSRGVELKDSDGVLKGKGKFRRHINVKSLAELDFDVLATLVRQASKLTS